jgi:outer membrane biogenesis lipoprotein LolB
MKSATALKISLLIIVLALLTSCASSQSYSAASDPCSFQNQKKIDNRKGKRVEAPPSKTTPIGGNYRIRG